MTILIATWNLEHADRLISQNLSDNILERRHRIRETIKRISPDILCIQEGPRGEQAIVDFCSQVLDDQWHPVLLRQPGEDLGFRDKEYQLKGTQWIWFLVKTDLRTKCRLQSPLVWQAFISGKTWKVNYWGIEKSSRHSHYRHPQVLIMDIGDNQEIEFIGVHLKSKINRKKIILDEEDNLIGDFVTTALTARIKLAIEAHNIREYIEAKFMQLEHPGIVVMGDCNDGPGQDLFENQYLFFDLISNLQGEVIIAERFFNHALFDYSGELRWTAKYRDAIKKISAEDNPLLLDHILISQPLCQGNLSFMVNEQAGRVEHEEFERNNVGSNSKTRTSDHRPVSCKFNPT